MVAKDASHVSLYDAVDKVVRHGYTDEDGNRHWFRFVNGVPINKSHTELLTAIIAGKSIRLKTLMLDTT